MYLTDEEIEEYDKAESDEQNDSDDDINWSKLDVDEEETGPTENGRSDNQSVSEYHGVDVTNLNDEMLDDDNLDFAALDDEERVGLMESLVEEHGEEPVYDLFDRLGDRKFSSHNNTTELSEAQMIANEALGTDHPLRDEGVSRGDFEPTKEHAAVYSDLLAISDEFKQEHLADENGEVNLHRGIDHRSGGLSASIMDDPEADEYDFPSREVTASYTSMRHKAESFADEGNLVHTKDTSETESLALDSIGLGYEPDENVDLSENPIGSVGHEDFGKFHHQEEDEHLVAGVESVDREDLSLVHYPDKDVGELVQKTTETPEEAGLVEHNQMEGLVRTMASDKVAPETEEGVERVKDWGEYVANENEKEDGRDLDHIDLDNVNDVIRGSAHDVEPLSQSKTESQPTIKSAEDDDAEIIDGDDNEDNDDDAEIIDGDDEGDSSKSLAEIGLNPSEASHAEHDKFANDVFFISSYDLEPEDEEDYDAIESWGKYVDEHPHADHGVHESDLEDVNNVLEMSPYGHEPIGEGNKKDGSVSSESTGTPEPSNTSSSGIEPGVPSVPDVSGEDMEVPEGVDVDHNQEGLEESADLGSYTPDDIENTDNMDAVNATDGNTMEAKQVVEFEDGTQAVHTNTHHEDGDEELGRRAVAASSFSRELHDEYADHGVPEIDGEPDEGYFFTAPVPGEDAVDASDEAIENVDEEDFYKHAANQVMLGNNDAHHNNVKVDDDGGLHWFDQDHSGGDIDDPSAHNKKFKYDNGWDRIHGELARVGESLELGEEEEIIENIKERTIEEANEIDEERVESAREAAAEHDEEFANNMFSNIMKLRSGEAPE